MSLKDSTECWEYQRLELPAKLPTPNRPKRAADPLSKRSRQRARRMLRSAPQELQEALAESLEVDPNVLYDEHEAQGWPEEIDYDADEEAARDMLGDDYCFAVQSARLEAPADGMAVGDVEHGDSAEHPLPRRGLGEQRDEPAAPPGATDVGTVSGDGDAGRFAVSAPARLRPSSADVVPSSPPAPGISAHLGTDALQDSHTPPLPGSA